MARTPPGETRQRVYQFVRRRILAGNPPTIREVQAAMGFAAVESARGHLNALVQEGRLAKQPGRSRGYTLGSATNPGQHQAVTLVPLIGQVQAGDLSLALESPEGYLPVRRRPSGEQLFALTVRGKSMMGAGILPGDQVIVRAQPTADNGDVVVGLVGEEATVKTLRIRRGRVELHPANPRFEPIRPDPRDLQILGKVIEVRRPLE